MERAREALADIEDLIDSDMEGLSETDELELYLHDYLLASWQVSLFRRAHTAALTAAQEAGR